MGKEHEICAYHNNNNMECECFCESKSKLLVCGDSRRWGRIQVTIELSLL